MTLRPRDPVTPDPGYLCSRGCSTPCSRPSGLGTPSLHARPPSSVWSSAGSRWHRSPSSRSTGSTPATAHPLQGPTQPETETRARAKMVSGGTGWRKREQNEGLVPLRNLPHSLHLTEFHFFAAVHLPKIAQTDQPVGAFEYFREC